MAVPLKGFLRRLRAEGAGWSYAVFWKTVQSANSRNLVWGEGDYGIPTVTGPDIPSPGLNNGTLRKSLQGGVEDQVVQRIAVMVENTMKPKVHVAGHGIVGIAGLTGNHRWVVHGTVSCDAYITQGLAEFNNQWFSGIQTVAIIPVLPHGVLQLGSTQQIMENLELVTQTRRTFAQMVCILEPSMTESFLNNSLEKGPDWAPPMGCANTNHQDRQNLDFGHLMQPSVSSISEVNWSRPSIPEPSASSIPPFTGFVNSINEFLQQKAHPNIKTIFPRFGELPNGSDGHNIISDINTMFNRQIVAADPTSENQCNTSHSLDLPSDNPGSLQQLFSTLTSQNIRYLPGDKFVQPSFHGPTAPSYSTASTLILPSRREEPFTNENVYGKLGSLFNRSKANAPIAFKNKPSQVLASVIVDDTTASISCHPTLSTTETHCLTETGPCVASAPLSQKHKNSGDLLQAHLVSYKDLPDHISGSYINAREIDQISGISLPAGRATQNRTCDPKGTVLDEWNVCSNDSKALASVDVVDEDVFQASVVCSSGSDLFDVLGLNQECDPYTDKVDALVKTSAMDNCKYGTNDSTYITHLDKQHNFSTSSCIPRSEALPDYRNDELLDAVVSRVNNAVRQETDEASCRTSLTRTTGSSYSNGYLNCSHPGSARNFQKETFDLSPTMLQAGIDGSTNFRPSCSINEIGECSRIEGICNSQNNLWVDNENTRNEAAPAQYKMSEDLGKSNRKRAKPGENPRPRPKDRQMIQDRVKELREIVPNGAKLSIDALLERTINHMLFLQSVTKHADKLKETREPKIISQEGGLLLKDNFEGGATWAFEVGSQSMICPIIVEDLNPPRQLLVEMLCEQRGLFLEIADLIKGLGLTILKGVMEARNDKIWARFAVEANRDVTRMDIFLSLVQLLEPRAVSSVPQQHFDGINMTNNVVGQPIAATCTVNPLM